MVRFHHEAAGRSASPADDVNFANMHGRRLRACFIGAGGHAQRNIYPGLDYAPVELTAICDLDENLASMCARRYGVPRHYTDVGEMLESEEPEAVFIVTGYHADGRVQATKLALQALTAGCHVWMEKPTAASSAEIRQLMDASRRSGRHVMTGLKKVFSPAIEKTKQILDSDAFGTPASISVRYPEALSPLPARRDVRNLTGFLDHIYHPAAILGYLMGRIDRAAYEWEEFNGGTVTSLRFRSGAIGTLHLVAGMSGASPLERVEVVGQGANVLVENGVTLTYYRPAERPLYGQADSYLVDDAHAPLRWQPEFSLGQLYNKNIFYLGYVAELRHFCTAVLDEVPLQRGRLEDSLEIMRLFEFYRETPAGTSVAFDST